MLHITDDEPIWRDEFKILTKEQLHIPALHMIGHAHFQEVGEKLDDHFHCNMEFVVIINGTQQYVVDGKRYTLSGNDIFMTYPYEHHGNGESSQAVCEFIWFQFDMSSSQNFLGLMPPHSEYLFRQLLNYKKRTKKANMKDIPILLKAFQLLGSQEISKQTLGYSYFLQFVIKNICTSDIELTKEVYSSDIQDSLGYIHSHLMEDLSIEAIADACGMSPSHFKAKFKEQVGITPHGYVMALKIDSAKIYLKSTDKSITEVAFLFNFSSGNHFSSAFKQYTGYTPTYFRNHRFSNIY